MINVSRFPSMFEVVVASLIPRSIPYGVFVGLLHRGYRICSTAKDFVSYVCEVGSTLRANGCSIKRLKFLFFWKLLVDLGIVLGYFLVLPYPLKSKAPRCRYCIYIISQFV